jgi:hypothetical protein
VIEIAGAAQVSTLRAPCWRVVKVDRDCQRFERARAGLRWCCRLWPEWCPPRAGVVDFELLEQHGAEVDCDEPDVDTYLSVISVHIRTESWGDVILAALSRPAGQSSLALAQAARAMVEMAIPADEYLRVLRSHAAALLAEGQLIGRRRSIGLCRIGEPSGPEGQGTRCPAVRKSSYHSARVKGMSEPSAAAVTRSGVVVPRTTCMFAGWRVIQAVAIAIGVLRAIADLGLEADDVSVVGYDDIELARHPLISLTTVDNFGVEMGVAAVELLMERISDGRRIAKHHRLDPQLRIRRSSRLIRSDSA